MSSPSYALRDTMPGVVVVAILASFSTWAAEWSALQSLRVSPLIVGILLGVALANLAGSRLPAGWTLGITFSAKKLLKLAIILYGFRITFTEIAAVGWGGLLLDATVVALTLVFGIYAGVRWLGVDRETSIMTASGAAICGAAAIVATAPIVKAESHQTSIAVATVLTFGTVAMFLYPLAYRTGLIPMSEDVFGVYIGASIHNVGHAVAAAGAISSETAATAVIVKMTRVMMLAPALIVLGWFVHRGRPDDERTGTGLVIPWFAVAFVGVAAFNTFDLLPRTVVQALVTLDTFLLTMAMTALGLGTVLSKFKGMGWRVLKLATLLAVWLIVGGFVLTLLFMGTGQ